MVPPFLSLCTHVSALIKISARSASAPTWLETCRRPMSRSQISSSLHLRNSAHVLNYTVEDDVVLGDDPDNFEDAPLLNRQEFDAPPSSGLHTLAVSGGLGHSQLLRVYLSHLLSTWNYRCYEFAAVRTSHCFLVHSLLPSKYLVKILFTASAYPGTLAASSIRLVCLSSLHPLGVLILTSFSGLLANLSAMALAPWIGRWADRHPSRLRSLQLTIIVQRCSICVACIGWSFLLNISLTDNDNGSGKGNNSKIRTLTMSFLVFLGMIERVSAVANILVMERDWVLLSSRI